MKLTRAQTVLASILFVQVVLILLLRTPLSGGADTRQSGPLVPELSDVEPRRIELREGEDGPLTLERSEDGWSIRELGGYPADLDRVRDLVERLRDVRVARPVLRNSRYHKSLGVTAEDAEACVRFWIPGDDEGAVTLWFGNSPNYRTIHVRRDGEDEVYEVRDLATYDVASSAGSWVERKFLSVPADRIEGIRIENASGVVELERTADGWSMLQPRAAAANPDAVAELIAAVANVSLSDPEGPLDEDAQGFARPAALVSLRLSPGTDPEDPENGSREIVLRVGAAVPGSESQRYVSKTGFEYAGRAWNSSLERLLEEDGERLRGS